MTVKVDPASFLNSKSINSLKMFFQSKLLQSAMTAAAFVNVAHAVFVTSNDDLGAFPEFEAAMQSAGTYLQWKSYQVQTGSGYNLVLFRLVADSNG